MSKIIRMTSVIAKLQTTLDVYEGLYAEKDNAAVTIVDFPEIGLSLKQSLCTHLIIGCAAIFSDPEKSCGNENMSLRNIVCKNESKLSPDSVTLLNEINQLVDDMNLKTFRNKHVGHYGLEECLGFNEVQRDITVDKLRVLLSKSLVFINFLIRDAELLAPGNHLDFYRKIPECRGTNVFLERLSKNA